MTLKKAPIVAVAAGAAVLGLAYYLYSSSSKKNNSSKSGKNSQQQPKSSPQLTNTKQVTEPAKKTQAEKPKEAKPVQQPDETEAGLTPQERAALPEVQKLIREAITAWKENKLQEAEMKVKAALELYKQSALALLVYRSLILSNPKLVPRGETYLPDVLDKRMKLTKKEDRDMTKKFLDDLEKSTSDHLSTYFQGEWFGLVHEELPKAIDWYKQAAEMGNGMAYANLGILSQAGLGLEKDDKMAVEYFRKAADLGNADGMYFLGSCYRNGTGVEQQLGLAVDWTRRAAIAGLANAQLSLANLYENGDGVMKDPHQSVEWLSEATAQGFAEAQHYLAWCYERGSGVKQDWKTAIELYTKAADQEFSPALTKLAFCYEEGQGVDKEDEVAVKYYKKAADHGDPSAALRLAVGYENGLGMEIDMEQAIEYYKLAGTLGDVNALTRLGMLYYEGASNVPSDHAESFEWFKKAAEASGDANIQTRVGEALFRGDGVTQDFPQAFEWFMKAAEQDFPAAQECVGTCYLLGAPEKDVLKAVQYLAMAADKGEDSAHTLLGLIYERGDEESGLPQDLGKAIEYYTKGAALGSNDAKMRLDMIKQQMRA